MCFASLALWTVTATALWPRARTLHPTGLDRSSQTRARVHLATTTTTEAAVPRWFDPLLEFGLDEPRPDPERLPLLLFLPGADGSGITAWMQYPSLAQEYDVRALSIPSADRSSHQQLVKLVTEEVVAAASSGDSREIFLLG